MPKTPRYPALLIILTLTLAISSGHRAVDYAMLGRINGEDWDTGPIIGAALMPVYYVPFALLTIIFLGVRTSESSRINLFFWNRASFMKQLLFSILFGVPTIFSIYWSSMWIYQISSLTGKEEYPLLLDASLNFISSASSVYVWLCFRAIACQPKTPQTPSKLQD